MGVNSFASYRRHDDCWKTYHQLAYCTIYICEHPDQCGLFVDVITQKPDLNDLLPLWRWIKCYNNNNTRTMFNCLWCCHHAVAALREFTRRVQHGARWPPTFGPSRSAWTISPVLCEYWVLQSNTMPKVVSCTRCIGQDCMPQFKTPLQGCVYNYTYL